MDARPPVTITQADLDALGGGPSEEGDPVRRFPRQPVAPPDNAAFAGNIGVAPIQGAARAVSRAAAPAAPTGDDPIAAYKRAYNLYRAGQGAAAESAFAAFVERYGTHDYADNALFWIGQVQFDEARFQAALATFHRVVTEHPAGNKVPDALLMIGLTQAKLGRGAEGRETLARLRAMYPQTEAARKADARLQPGNM
ncbi:MAG: tol-pal system protein YbgF [bacterium]